MSDEIVDITADEAVEAIVEADFVTDEGRHVTHTFKGSFGADWDTEDVIQTVREKATRICWANHLFGGRCLAIEVPGETVTWFDNVHPLPKSEKEARGE